jgi:hypothetical protein
MESHIDEAEGDILVYEQRLSFAKPALGLKDNNMDAPSLRESQLALKSNESMLATPESSLRSLVGKRKKLPPIEGKAQVEDILNYIFPPKKVEIEGKQVEYFVSPK